MKERPILLNGPMVQKVMTCAKCGRVSATVPCECGSTDFVKTMTRRVVRDMASAHPPCALKPCPYGVPGDRLWVRESARVISVRGGSREIDIVYRADNTFKTVSYPSRLAPAPKGKLLSNGTYREASRIMLEITAVRVERLQNITEEDAKAEGTTPSIVGADLDNIKYRAGFQTLWDSINGNRYDKNTGFRIQHEWRDNPWVWVVEFKRQK